MSYNQENIYVSQKAVLYREDGTILAIRRTETAPSRPLHWDLPGGELERGEEAYTDIAREVEEETGLEVSELEPFDVVSMENDQGEFWVTICYKAKVDATEVVLSYEHDDAKWVTPEEFQELKTSPRLKQFMRRFALGRRPMSK